MFAHHNPHIMDIRGESVNILALLRAVPKIHLGAVAYLEAYIDFVKPKLILSRTDNNPTLWQLKRRPNSTYKVALIQNGWRPEQFGSLQVWESKIKSGRKPSIDCAFVFGTGLAEIGLNNFSVKIIASGSTKLNQIEISKPGIATLDIVLISEYRTNDMMLNPDYYDIDRRFNRALLKFGIQRDLEIHVAGAVENQSGMLEEKSWYQTQFGNNKWKFHPRNSTSSYGLVASAKMVVTVDSTMGYEALSLGRKTAMLTCRYIKRWQGFELIFDRLVSKLEGAGVDISKVNQINNRFGASLSFPETGFFWSNVESEEEFDRVLTNVYEASDNEWERISRPFADQLMVHDYGNTKIRAYVEGVLTGSLKSN
jgi:surface carbohydrate biosynthesis protein